MEMMALSMMYRIFSFKFLRVTLPYNPFYDIFDVQIGYFIVIILM